jgi:hypothetical protein
LELSIFNILNIFCWQWFLSVDHLRANALSAQKAESRKIFWVEFTPQFHSHLVKCTVALMPHPLLKEKKVMFVYILELLNQEGPQAFFNLAKGTRIATQAQKEKKHLAWRRTCTVRQESWKAAKEAAQGWPHQQCKLCGCKFATHKAKKQHHCPISKEASSKSGTDKGKGNANAPSRPNKLAPTKKSSAPSKPHLTPTPTEAIVAAVVCPPPTSAREAAAFHTLSVTLHGVEEGSLFLQPKPSSSCWSQCLNTVAKCNIQKGVMDTVCDKM